MSTDEILQKVLADSFADVDVYKRQAQPTIADAVRNIFISTPISAMILAALSSFIPGRV